MSKVNKGWAWNSGAYDPDSTAILINSMDFWCVDYIGEPKYLLSSYERVGFQMQPFLQSRATTIFHISSGNNSNSRLRALVKYR